MNQWIKPMTEDNPYVSPGSNSNVTRESRWTLRNHPVLTLLLSIVLGMMSGLAVLAFTIAVTAHRGVPPAAYYTLGPAIWLWRFSVGSPSVFMLAGATCVAWTAYWWFALAGTAKLPAIARLIAITVFHVLSVVLFQLMFGLP